MIGLFGKLWSFAADHNIRIVAVNRRLYGGSTSYTPEEMAAMAEGTENEVVGVLEKQGVYLALFMDALIQELDLPEKSVAIAGWSLGMTFLALTVNAMLTLGHASRKRLADHVISFIFWGMFQMKSDLMSASPSTQTLHLR
jgi:pimeloyl-ACP methyl ester carboxylesterase